MLPNLQARGSWYNKILLKVELVEKGYLINIFYEKELTKISLPIFKAVAKVLYNFY